DLKVTGEIFIQAGADIPAIGGDVGHVGQEAGRRPVQSALLKRAQIERYKITAVPEVDLVAPRIDTGEQERGLARRRRLVAVGQLRDLAAAQVDAKQVRAITAVGAKQQPAAAVVPARVGKVEMVAVPFIV